MADKINTIGIIAAAGNLPVLLAEALHKRGKLALVVALTDIADHPFPKDIAVHTMAAGAIGEIVALLKTQGCQEVLFSGQLPRLALSALPPGAMDAMTKGVAKQAFVASDNDALEMVAQVFAQHGLPMADLRSLVPEMFAPLGCIAGKPLDALSAGEQMAVSQGLAVLQQLGGCDVGQAVVAQERRVLAIEAAEGTDNMLGRVYGLVDTSLTPPVLVKAPKSAQNRKLDPPVVGTHTIDKAKSAGIGTIVVEAGGVIIADKEASIKAAQQHQVSLIGVETGG